MTEKRLRVKTKRQETYVEETLTEKLSRLLKSKELSDMEAKELVDIGGGLDVELKALEKKHKAVKVQLKEYATATGKEKGIEGETYNYVISPKKTTEVVKTPTEFMRFLKSIGKLDVVDAVLSIPLTNLKDYIDVHTLEREKIIETTTNVYGTTKFKKR